MVEVGNNWYIVACAPNCEKKAAGEIRRAGFRAYLPRSAKEVRHNRTKVPSIKRRPLLCGYLFVRFPEHSYDRRGVPPFGVARACQGVKDFLKAMNDRNEWEPFAIPSRVVAALMRRERGREFGRPAVDRPEERRSREQQRLKRRFVVGERFEVREGPFEGFLATIAKLNENGAVETEVVLFGRSNRVTFKEPEQSLRAVLEVAA